MKFSYSMLLDLVNTRLDAEGVGDLLTMAGFELEGIEEGLGEPVLDIKVVSNRGDGLSLLGLAREVLAKDSEASPTALYEASSRLFGYEPSTEGKIHELTSVTLESPDCDRYACLLFDNVANGQAPEWIRRRLTQAGMRPISLLVDLTNYVMLEQGQPLHAFDFDKLRGRRIVVRNAREGEELTTLDGVTHKLRSEQTMICDAERPVAAAGVMGGAETEVDKGTMRVLLESAHFRNTSVRRTRKQLGLSTEASYRFERSVDPELVAAALLRFADLLRESGGSSPVSGLIDARSEIVRPSPIPLRLERAERLLGMPITAEQARGYLSKLGFVVDEESAAVTPPTWRPDVVREEDLIEELGRVHGYERIPELLPQGTTTLGGPQGFELWTDAVREAALRTGFAQAISHSLRDAHPLDENALERIGPRNPSSPETALLRDSLLPSLADAARRNGARTAHLFEIGHVFGRREGPYIEVPHLALLSAGALEAAGWTAKEPPSAGFFTLKGTIEEIAESTGLLLRLQPPTEPDPRLHPTRQAELFSGSLPVGRMGQLHPDAAEACGLPEETCVAELMLREAYEAREAALEFRPLSRNPAVRRDISVEVEMTLPYQTVRAKIDEACGEILERQWLADVYEGPGIPEGRRSLTLSLQLRKMGENLTDEEANQVRERAVAALEGLGARPR